MMNGLCQWINQCMEMLLLNGRDSKAFVMRVGVHQGSVLSPLLFVTVLEALSREF